MHYLIDGHNLIASINDISIEDPNDEIKLILRLRRWSAAGRKRRVTVIFDGGLPGGEARHLSTGPVKVVFAPEGKTADNLLIHRLRKVRNPTEFTLISSDREVLSAAKNKRVPTITSRSFAKQLPGEPAERQLEIVAEGKATPVQVDKDEQDPEIGKEDVAEWLELFRNDQASIGDKPSPIPSGREMTLEEAKRALERFRDQAAESEVTEEPPSGESDPELSSKSSSEALKSGARDLSDDEIDDWLNLFAQSKNK